MGCFCQYAKAQALALMGHGGDAKAALAAARASRASNPVFRNPHVAAFWAELDTATAGYIAESEGRLSDALTAYRTLAATSPPEITSRIAALELKQGRTDEARTWAFIHADDPTSQWVLAELALRAHQPLVAQLHVTNALARINRELSGSDEFEPIYYALTPSLRMLHRRLPAVPRTASPAAPARPGSP